MTREEAINHLKTVAKSAIDSGYDSAVVDAVDMAREALEQEPCEDAVSREAVEDIVMWYDGQGEMLDEIQKLPSVQPKQKTEHWIEDTNGTYTDNHDTWECSECGHAQILLEGTPKDNDYNYCPNCGAKMAESEDKGGIYIDENIRS